MCGGEFDTAPHAIFMLNPPSLTSSLNTVTTLTSLVVAIISYSYLMKTRINTRDTRDANATIAL